MSKFDLIFCKVYIYAKGWELDINLELNLISIFGQKSLKEKMNGEPLPALCKVKSKEAQPSVYPYPNKNGGLSLPSSFGDVGKSF